jgi:FkbM family methyltransferase
MDQFCRIFRHEAMIEACQPFRANATFPIILPRPVPQLSSDVACSHPTRQSRVVNALFNISGTFVEFGGNDGFHESNTRFLECRGWRGVLIEAIRREWSKSCINRPLAVSVHSAVCSIRGLVDISIPKHRTAASGIRQHMSELSDNVFMKRSVVTTESVICRPLTTIVDKHQCIDYLSIDVEGAEWSILRDFVFENMCIHVISVEMHATSQTRNLKIADKLTTNGFRLIDTVPVWNMHIADEIYVNHTFLNRSIHQPRSWLRPKNMFVKKNI